MDHASPENQEEFLKMAAIQRWIGEHQTRLRREIKWEPGYDHRDDPDPLKSQYGAHGLQIRFMLHGDKGTIQFLLYTNWIPNEVLMSRGTVPARLLSPQVLRPLAADLGYHADKPQYEDHKPMDTCEHRPSGKCYYDGSGLAADGPFGILLVDGEDAMWKYMEDYYWMVFESHQDHTCEPRSKL